MARRRKRDPDLVEVFGSVLLLGLLALLAGSKFQSVLNPNSGFVIALVVCLVAILLLIFMFFRSSAPSNDEVRVPEINSKRAPAAAVHDDSRYQPKSTIPLSQQLHSIDWFQFEKLVELAYSPTHKVTRRGGANPDGGIDLIIESATEQTAVQCKHWKSWKVGVRNVRELIGAMADAGLKTGILVTIKGYSREADELAHRHGIELIGQEGILELLRLADPTAIQTILHDKRKYCPKCEREMILRTATKGFNVGGQFWGCSGYPRCTFILRDIPLAQSQATTAGSLRFTT